ncbi:MAG: HAMP domain-containing protein [Calditrichaeota bacterium]|nr:MAG: HAMP domain-containing protein [Calditrichota bacterium]
MNKIWIKLSAVIVVIVLILMAIVFYFFTARQILSDRNELRLNMQRIAMQIASIRLAQTEDLIIYQEWIKRILESEAGKDIVYIAIFDKERRVLAYSLNLVYLEIPNTELLTTEDELEIVEQLSRGQVDEASWNDFDHVPVEIRSGRQNLGKVDVGFSLVDFNQMAKRKLYVNIYILGGAFISVVLLSIFIGKRITHPLNQLSNAMIDISHGNYTAQIAARSNDEIGRLTNSFNYMSRRLHEKARLEDFSRDLVFTFEYTKLLQMVTERIVTYMNAQQGVLFLLHVDADDAYAVSMWGHPQHINPQISISFDENCLNECLRFKEPFIPSALRHRSTFNEILVLLRAQILLEKVEIIAPLVSQGETLGFLLLAPENDPSGYDADEMMFLRTLSQQSGMAIRNGFLLRELAEQERLQKELEIARDVQQNLLPLAAPKLQGVEISGVCVPAEEVGGDYYDFFHIDDHRVGIALADVSGKGTSAAFYMAEIKGMMNSLTHLIASPKELVRHLNNILNKNPDKRIFTTMIYGVLDVDHKDFTFVRAGHNALVVKRANQNGDIDVLIPPGMALGLAKDELFGKNIQEANINFDSGDILFLYTDGISEAMNDQSEEFGEERLYSLICEQEKSRPHEMQRQIIRHINEFSNNRPQHDDITMIVAKFS